MGKKVKRNERTHRSLGKKNTEDKGRNKKEEKRRKRKRGRKLE